MELRLKGCGISLFAVNLKAFVNEIGRQNVISRAEKT